MGETEAASQIEEGTAPLSLRLPTTSTRHHFKLPLMFSSLILSRSKCSHEQALGSQRSASML